MTTEAATIDVARRDAFAERLFNAAISTMEVWSVYIGDRLGLYRALAERGASTSAELAASAGVDERYAREWLEQQAVAGILEVAEDGEAGQRRFRLAPEHAEVLLDRDSLNYLAPFARLVLSPSHAIGELLAAYRTGGGVAWEAYGDDVREGQAEANRPAFLSLLGTEWFPAIPDVHARLQSSPPARIADIACGEGWSSIGFALAYPLVEVDGYDLDAPAIERARRHAAEAGVADRVRFHARDASDPDLEGHYDLVTIFEALHDVSRPVEVLANARRLAGDSGAVVVMDERVAEHFTAPGDEIERMMYGWSVLICLANGLAEQPSAATGTVLRPQTLRGYALDAGFGEVEVLPIENDFFRFYRLHA